MSSSKSNGIERISLLEAFGMVIPIPVSKPSWTPLNEYCPICSAQLCSILIKVSIVGLKASIADCRFKGCPCCDYRTKRRIEESGE